MLITPGGAGSALDVLTGQVQQEEDSVAFILEIFLWVQKSGACQEIPSKVKDKLQYFHFYR